MFMKRERTAVDIIVDTMELCALHYDTKGLDHAMTVAKYAKESAEDIRGVSSTDAYIVGLCHDLLEDTDISHELLSDTIGSYLFTHVLDLTKTDDETYREYCERCADEGGLTYVVKRADLKDHFTRKDTLTDRLKEKYLSVVDLFLE